MLSNKEIRAVAYEVVRLQELWKGYNKFLSMTTFDEGKAIGIESFEDYLKAVKGEE